MLGASRQGGPATGKGHGWFHDRWGPAMSAGATAALAAPARRARAATTETRQPPWEGPPPARWAPSSLEGRGGTGPSRQPGTAPARWHGLDPEPRRPGNQGTRPRRTACFRR